MATLEAYDLARARNISVSDAESIIKSRNEMGSSMDVPQGVGGYQLPDITQYQQSPMSTGDLTRVINNPGENINLSSIGGNINLPSTGVAIPRPLGSEIPPFLRVDNQATGGIGGTLTNVTPQSSTGNIRNADGTLTSGTYSKGMFGSNLSSGQTYIDPNTGQTITGGMLYDSTTPISFSGYQKINPKATLDQYNAMEANQIAKDTASSGKVADYAGAAVGIGGLLGSLYFNQKNLGLQEDWADYQKSRNAQSDARKTKFAQGVGGTY